MATYHVTHDATGGGDGSWASPWTLQEAADNAVAGDTVKVHNTGVYETAAGIDFDTNSGTYTAVIQFIGVGSGETDGPEMVTVRLTAADAYVTYVNAQSWLYFENITADADGYSTGAAWNVGNAADHVHLVNCKGTGADQDGFDLSDVDNASLVGCEAHSNGRFGFRFDNTTTVGREDLIGCVAHHNTSNGFHCRDMSGMLLRCVAFENANHGLAVLHYSADILTQVLHCVAWRNTASGLACTVSHSGSELLFANNICTENGAYGIYHADAGAELVMFGNFCPGSGAEANTSGGIGNAVDLGNPGSVLKANQTGAVVADFVDPTSCYPDLRLDVGSDARGAAWPGALPICNLCTTTTTGGA